MLRGRLYNAVGETVQCCRGDCNAAGKTAQCCQGDCNVARLSNAARHHSQAELHSLPGSIAQCPQEH